MPRLHKGSKGCGDTILRNLANVPDTCTDIEDVVYREVPPINSVSDSTSLSLEYDMNCMVDNFAAVADVDMHMQLQVLHEDGSRLEPGENVGPVNCFPQAVIAQSLYMLMMCL